MTTPAGPRWQKWKQVHNEAVLNLSQGDHNGLRQLDEAYRLTRTRDGDPERLARRAATLMTMANLTSGQESHDRLTAAIELAERVEAEVGDRFGTVALRGSLYAFRAQEQLVLGDWRAAFADLAASTEIGAEAVPGLHPNIVTVVVVSCVHHVAELRHHAEYTEAEDVLEHCLGALDWFEQDREPRRTVLLAARAQLRAQAGDYARAAADADTAMDLAQEHAPEAIPSVHTALGEIADGTGDRPRAVEHHRLAQELYAALGDVEQEAVAWNSLGRLAHLGGDDGQARRCYDKAATLGEDPWHRTTARFGQAAVAVSTGRPAEALAVLADPLDDSPRVQVSVLGVRASAHDALGDFAAADACLAQARARCADSGLWHFSLVLAWWHSDRILRRTASGLPREPLAAQALDLALPAALAAEAARHRFPAGPLRERWIRLATAPAAQAAMTAIRMTGDIPLAVAYLDHLAASVALPATPGTAPELAELLSLPAPADLALAAGGPGQARPVPDLLLPPRVRVDPAKPGPLEPWLALAEQRYGLPVRSAEVVRAW
ncbi:tetratricopeptide (TPR) repeat protein [Crossiella equi]|uniref:Tetratricopeptide (TPR) repeat protein n=1 Tax=Crossiella equi TaxID=130796 RepID=A0ABS5ALU5_9PSEU|nr:hypothetical protein [Crossiella equi]MBP2476665.1 tetratricopeptide (TPR) repeat protein [Crossiella equi]